MLSDWSYILTVAILAIAALSTRIAGALLMLWIVPTPRIERFLEGLSVSVIAALVASILVSTDARMMVATLVAVCAMALSRSVVWAMLAGMVTAAAYPFIAVL